MWQRQTEQQMQMPAGSTVTLLTQSLLTQSPAAPGVMQNPCQPQHLGHPQHQTPAQQLQTPAQQLQTPTQQLQTPTQQQAQAQQ
jgi:hypothetical protein